MNSIILYFVQVTVIFSVLYFLYILLLEKLTFHKANRFVLLLLLPLSLVVPFSNNLTPSMATKVIEIPLFEHLNFETINKQIQVVEQPVEASSFDYSLVFISIYVLMFLIFIVRNINATRQILS